MANAKVERKTMSYEFEGFILSISNEERTLRTFDFETLPEDLHDDFLRLGMKTKLANFAASAKAEKRDRIEMIDEGWAQLKEGVWEKEREGGGPTVSVEVEALAELKGVSVAEIQKALRKYDAETKADILKNPKVIQVAARIKAEREAGGEIDLTDL